MFSILSLSHHPRSGSRVHGLAILLVLGLVSLACAGPIQARSEGDGNLPDAELDGMLHPAVGAGAGMSSVQTQGAPPPTQPANLPVAAIQSQNGPYHLFFQGRGRGKPTRNPNAVKPVEELLKKAGIEIDKIDGVPTEFGDKSSIKFQLRDQNGMFILRGTYKPGPVMFLSAELKERRCGTIWTG
ncbi:hypothetical protein EV360DRAFT_90270 [Lentinula raphanica]|nr:hypothetical protein EV360DRAFT_90270 [Lentinula raphanica]